MTISPLSAVSSAAIGAGVAPVQSGDQTPASAAPPAIGPQSAALAALDAAVQTAAGRQSGLAPLLADLEVALQTPGLPAPVLAAAAQVLGLRMPLDPAPAGADLRQAMTQSGLFLETLMASSDTPAGPDLKAALLALSQALETWLGGGGHGTPTARSPAPPYAGGPVRGQPPTAASLPPGASAETVGGRLVQQTGGAIARQVLLQAGSLPGQPRAADQAQNPQWLFEIPLATPQGAAVAQFEIARDGGRGGEDEDPPVWRARFSLHLEPMGPVHAKIALRGDQVHVSLWAENAGTADQLATQSADLSNALRADDLSATVSVAPGAPAVAPPPAGRLVDQAL